MVEKSKSLAVIEDLQVPQVLNQQDVMEEMDGLTFSFTHIKIPSGGGLAFEVPGDDADNPDIEKEIEGVIVFHHPVNAFWDEAFTGGNEPPDCYSMDGKVGIGAPGGNCKTCPMNEWGSGREGTGKACQNRRRIYILRQGEQFPLLLSLPPTSLGNFSNFISRSILQKSIRSYAVVAKAKLSKVKSSGGIEYSQVSWSLSGRVDEKIIPEIIQYSQAMKALAAGVMVEDVEGSENYDTPEPANTETIGGFTGRVVEHNE